jgi:hypothetical protein
MHQAMRGLLLGHCLPQAKLWELYTVDVEVILTQFSRMSRERGPQKHGQEELKIIQDPLFRRCQSTVDMEQALALYNIHRYL